MTLLDEETRRLWHHNAARGSPPPVPEVAELQYGMKSPWFLRENFYDILTSMKVGSQRKNFYCREMSRGHGKTRLVHLLVLYAAEYVIPYLDIGDENRNIIVVGRDEKHLLRSLMRNIHRTICRHTPWLKTPEWQRILDDGGYAALLNYSPKNFNKGEFYLTNGVTIAGVTINQGVRGEHQYLICIDDLIDEKTWNRSEEFYELINGAFRPAVEFGGTLLVTGTPQASNDLYDLMGGDPRWDYVQLPAESNEYREKNEYAIKRGWLPQDSISCEEDWRCLWPWRMNHAMLREEEGSKPETILKYEREYLLKRVSSVDSYVPRELLMASLDPNLSYVHAAQPGEGPYYGGIDPSKLSRDDSAVCIGVLDKDGLTRIPRHWNVLDALGERAPPDPELLVIEAINSSSLAFHNPHLVLESNAFQSLIRPFLSKINPTVQIEHRNLGVEKHTSSGWLKVRNLFRNHHIKLPYGPTPDEAALIESGHLSPENTEARRLTDKLVQQIENLRIHEGKIVTVNSKVHDDMVSALFLFAVASESGVATEAISTVGSVGPRRDSKVPRDDPELGPRARSPTQLLVDRAARAQRLAATRRRPF